MQSFFGAKGGGSTFKQRPDTLRSNDTFEGLLGLCVGPIKGPKNGLRSIKIDGTPIENANGESNFNGMIAEFADGDPLKFPQKVAFKLGGGAASPLNVGLALSNPNASAPGPWSPTKTVTNPNADFLDLRFVVQQLYRQDKKGVYEATANLEIQMKPSNMTTWINPNVGTPAITYDTSGYTIRDVNRLYLQRNMFDVNGAWLPETNNGYFRIYGKTNSPTVYELRIAVPNEGAYADVTWDVRVRLIERETLDADPNFEKRTISWESISAGFTDSLGDDEEWRGLSWLQLFGQASDQLTGVPEVSGEYDTAIVQVPPSSVFNPTTRVYSGAIWDGSWEKAFTNDPAWLINWVISDGLSGISAIAPGSYLNKWDALELSKFCSEQVPDGAGGTEPRFSLNFKINELQKADELVRYLAGAVNAVSWDIGNGEWRCKVDKPDAAVDIFTPETIEGEFSYQHSDIDTRFNDVTMTFLNKDKDYEEDRVRVVDNDHIAKYGRRPTTLVAVGCTGRQEALRRAMFRLRTSTREYRMVSFTTNRRGRMLQRLDPILIADSDLNGSIDIRTTGRIISTNGDRTQISLRDTVRIEVGVNYKLHITIPNPVYDPTPTMQPATLASKPTITITRVITNSSAQRGDVRDIYLDSALPGSIALNANVALEAVGLPATPKMFRVLDIDRADDSERVTITAMEIDTGKWDAADNVSPADSVLQKPSAVVPKPLAPVSGPILSESVLSSDFSKRRLLTVNWARPDSRFLKGYQVRYKANGGTTVIANPFTTDTTFEMLDPAPGVYEFEIVTIDRRDRMSLPLVASIELLEVNRLPVTGYLSNESHTVATFSDGSGGDYSAAGGEFVIQNFLGRVTSGVAFSVFSETGVDVSIDATTGVFTVNGMSADNGTAVFQATYGGDSIFKVYTIAKSKQGTPGVGTPGASAKTLILLSDRQTISYSSAGAPSPALQTTTFTTSRQNTTAAITWSLTDANGNALTPVSSFLTVAGDTASATMTSTQFNNARGTSEGVIVTATLTDGALTLNDKISVNRVQAGAAGQNGVDGTLAWTPLYSGITAVRAGSTFTNPDVGICQVNSVETFAQARASAVWPASALSLPGDMQIGLQDMATGIYYTIGRVSVWGTDIRAHWSGQNQVGTGIAPAGGQRLEVAHVGTEIRGFVNGVDIGAPIATGIPVDRPLALLIIMYSAGQSFQNLTLSKAAAPAPGSFSIIAQNKVVVTGNTISAARDISQGIWEGKARTSASYTAGAAVSCTVRSHGGIGLDSNPLENNSFDTVAYWLFISEVVGGAVYQIYRNGALAYTVPGITPASGDRVTVVSDNKIVRYFMTRAGVTTLLYSHAVNGPNETLFGVANLAYLATYIEDFSFADAGMAGSDGIDGIDGVDGKLIEFVWRRAATQPATPSGNGIPAGWSDDPPAGTDPLWMSKAKQELDGNLVAGESWSVPIRHDGPAGAKGDTGAQGPIGPQGPTGGYPAQGITEGTTLYNARVSLNAGQATIVEARYATGIAPSQGSASLQVQIRPAGGAWVVMTDGTVTRPLVGVNEPINMAAGAASYTNNTGNAASFEVRVVITNTTGASEIPERCFMRPL